MRYSGFDDSFQIIDRAIRDGADNIMCMYHMINGIDIKNVQSPYRFSKQNNENHWQWISKLKKEAGSTKSAFVVFDESEMGLDAMYMPICRKAEALHWLGALPEDTELLMMIPENSLKEGAFSDPDLLPLFAYDATRDGIGIDPMWPRKSILPAARKYKCKWSGKAPYELEEMFEQGARSVAADNAKLALSKINAWLSDPDYSTSMSGDTVSKFADVLKLLSFGRVEYRQFEEIDVNLVVRCLPPEDFEDEEADNLEEAVRRFNDLFRIWDSVSENSAARFNFPFSMIREAPYEIEGIARAMGIDAYVNAYLEGVPLEDVLAG